jgi:small conductance mechanosensitive channel
MMALSQAWEITQQMVNSLMAALPGLMVGLLVAVLSYWASRWARTSAQRLAQTAGLSSSASIVLGRFARWLVLGVGLLLGLTIAVPSFTGGELIQLLGISSVAIGFAFHNILQNFLAGILLLLTEPFRIGDQIAVSGYEGTVKDIRTRATTIQTYDGRLVVIPNANLVTESVTVNTALDQRRTELTVGIGYGDDIGQAIVWILEAMRSVDGVSEEPAPDVLVTGLGDYSVNLRARWWTPSRRANVLGIQTRVIAAIKERLQENGIDLPFPTQQVLFHDQTEATDGDRARQREGWPAGKQPVPEPRSIAASVQRLTEVLGREEG